ncbi:hypothetical protein FH972_022241 [Carpinus fangiana]|uniref:Aminoglycoside phosphotransferase domain-containing protein n=1 Tax=Carpinus fangiana TaxID=176857 RepID=A0A5N6KS11_9ROSI|nr:hypothetical protein FH972_022241 [Carpinus fangiana]
MIETVTTTFHLPPYLYSINNLVCTLHFIRLRNPRSSTIRGTTHSRLSNMDSATTSTTRQPSSKVQSTTENSQPDYQFSYSSILGKPPYVLDPADLPDCYNPFPSKPYGIRAPDENTLVKYGKFVKLQEAEAMDFVSKHTTIACPKVIGAYMLDDVGYIVMSWEEAFPLSAIWGKASETEKEKVIDQLRDYVLQMRNIKGDYVGGFGRMPCVADEFNWDYHDHNRKYGPYDNEAGFNEGLISALDRISPWPRNEDPESPGYNLEFTISELVRSLKNHEIVFTHGDLHAANILVKNDFTVVIIDWATAGFYPEYWEFYKATWRDPFQPSFIRQIAKFIPAFWIEANIMEQIHRRISELPCAFILDHRCCLNLYLDRILFLSWKDHENLTKAYTVSVLLYGRTLLEQDDDLPCHVGIAIHEDVNEPNTCRLHHARCPNQIRFIYEFRPEQPYCTDPILRGRCELRSGLSRAEADRADSLLAKYGNEQEHLPFYGAGNCQNWLAGAVAMLEEAGLAGQQDGQYWTESIGKGRETMEDGWKKRGRCWVDNPKSLQAAPENVDARWRDKEERNVGKLDNGVDFGKRVEALEGLFNKRPTTDD